MAVDMIFMKLICWFVVFISMETLEACLDRGVLNLTLDPFEPVKENESVKLFCVWRGKPKFTQLSMNMSLWNRNGLVAYDSIYAKGLQKQDRFDRNFTMKHHPRTDNEFKLEVQLEMMNNDYAGKFWCQFERYGFGKIRSAQAVLEIEEETEKVKLFISPTCYSIEEGGEFSFTCKHSHNIARVRYYEPKLFFKTSNDKSIVAKLVLADKVIIDEYKGRFKITQMPTEGRVIFEVRAINATEYDSGFWFCEYGVLQSSDVKLKIVSQLKLTVNNRAPYVGDNIVLTCEHVRKTDSSVKVIYHPDRSILSEGCVFRNERVWIDPECKPSKPKISYVDLTMDDSGLYKCHQTDHEYKGITTNVTISVVRTPAGTPKITITKHPNHQYTHIGEEVHLVCSLSDADKSDKFREISMFRDNDMVFNDLELTWNYKQNFIVNQRPMGKKSLNITVRYATKMLNGMYYCKYGSLKSDSIQVRIGLPLTLSVNNRQSLEGQDVIFACGRITNLSKSGQQQEIASVYHPNGTQLSEGCINKHDRVKIISECRTSWPKIRFGPVAAADSGVYRCKLNDKENTEASETITVQSKKVESQGLPLTLSVNNRQSLEGQDVIFACGRITNLSKSGQQEDIASVYHPSGTQLSEGCINKHDRVKIISECRTAWPKIRFGPVAAADSGVYRCKLNDKENTESSETITVQSKKIESQGGMHPVLILSLVVNIICILGLIAVGKMIMKRNKLPEVEANAVHENQAMIHSKLLMLPGNNK